MAEHSTLSTRSPACSAFQFSGCLSSWSSYSLYKKLPYDPIRSFAPITLISVLPSVFVASPTFPAATIKDLIALARAQPGKLQYASSGRGTQSFLVAEAPVIVSMSACALDL